MRSINVNRVHRARYARSQLRGGKKNISESTAVRRSARTITIRRNYLYLELPMSSSRSSFRTCRFETTIEDREKSRREDDPSEIESSRISPLRSGRTLRRRRHARPHTQVRATWETMRYHSIRAIGIYFRRLSSLHEITRRLALTEFASIPDSHTHCLHQPRKNPSTRWISRRDLFQHRHRRLHDRCQSRGIVMQSSFEDVPRRGLCARFVADGTSFHSSREEEETSCARSTPP